MWVPSHINIPGNELADAAAKRATHSSPDEGILTPVIDWLNNIKRTIQQLWQIQWEIQRRAIRLIDDPAVTCHLQPLSHRRAVGDLSLFYRYSNGFCSSELTSIIPPLSKPARCTRGTSSHPRAVVLHT
nr:unnamed protein product [Callosobruchus chinensis]